MRFHRGARAAASWLAVLAMLMAALAPSISHALSGKAGASWIEVCTALGAKWVQPDLNTADQAPASDELVSFEHCPYCTAPASALALPTAPMAMARTRSSPDLLPAAFLEAPRTLHAWLSAPSRAPPRLC